MSYGSMHDPWLTNDAITAARLQAITDSITALNRDALLLPPLTGSGTTAAAIFQGRPCLNIGSATQDGVSAHGIYVPADFLGQAGGGLAEAILLFTPGQTGTVRLGVATTWQAIGSTVLTTDSLAAANYGVTANQLYGLDISDALTGLVSAVDLGFQVTRSGSAGADTITDCYVRGVYLRLRQ